MQNKLKTEGWIESGEGLVPEESVEVKCVDALDLLKNYVNLKTQDGTEILEVNVDDEYGLKSVNNLVNSFEDFVKKPHFL